MFLFKMPLDVLRYYFKNELIRSLWLAPSCLVHACIKG